MAQSEVRSCNSTKSLKSSVFTPPSSSPPQSTTNIPLTITPIQHCRLVSGSRTVLNQRQAAASGSLLDFARTLERRADSHLREANGGVISRAASEDLR